MASASTPSPGPPVIPPGRFGAGRGSGRGPARVRRPPPPRAVGRVGAAGGGADWPRLDGEKLIGTPGGKGSFHVALDRNTGAVLWKSPAEAGLYPSHAPMGVAEAAGVRQYAQNLGGGLVGVSAKDGQRLWR